MRTPVKFILLLTVAWLVAGFRPASAQEDAVPAAAPQPAPATSEPAPYPLDLPDVPPATNNPGLFPEGDRLNPPTTLRGSGRSRRNPSTTSTKRKGRSLDRTLQNADRDPLVVRIAYRRDKTVALARDPELGDLLRRANAAGTDEQKRGLLREYYMRLFATIRRIDSSPGMRAHLALLTQVAEQRYDPKRRVVAGDEELLSTRESAGRERLGR